MTLAAPTRVPILGTHVSASTFAGTRAFLADAVARRTPRTLLAATVYSVMLGFDRPQYRALVNRADYVMTDGMPLVWLLHARGHHAERVHGDDLLLSCFREFPSWRHFLVGGSSGQADRVVAELHRRFAGARIVGTQETPIRPVPPQDTARIVAAVAEAGADIVWVGMGTPAQDEWISEAATNLGCPLVGVGSAFDWLAGRTRAAPGWIKRSGLQWLFRLAQEPRRLWKRYLIQNPRFVFHASLELIRGWSLPPE